MVLQKVFATVSSEFFAKNILELFFACRKKGSSLGLGEVTKMIKSV